MKIFIKQLIIPVTLFLFSFSTMSADSVVQQWKQGLNGAKLTSYTGSVISSNSTLTVIKFCKNGRYSYNKEGSWSVPGTAGGASNNTINGVWDIQHNAKHVVLVYTTDKKEQGFFPIYLQSNGRVNIGGTAYAIQKNQAGC
ncbi:MAG: hypothetical protein DIZ80_04015 [endosymbiont of Galathealinum brachiosum]|uniref:Uncharacterized protein n=1 Tax=endosymbiont of Galathealinum brachiosum TaxID=2200906 RepID=A0A370DJT8_9GAMM|nr:MAG: hypothetical protein DIZ80_04015 [endosymbiont of Galathealinum brachiosum]